MENDGTATNGRTIRPQIPGRPAAHTITIVEAALAADTSINAALARDILSMLRGEPARPTPTTGEDDTLLTVAEVARRIGKTQKTVHYLAKRGVFRKVAFPGQRRASGIQASSVYQYFKETEQ